MIQAPVVVPKFAPRIIAIPVERVISEALKKDMDISETRPLIALLWKQIGQS